MNENYTDLLNRMGKLLEEVQRVKQEIVKQEDQIKEDIKNNTELLNTQVKVLNNLKNEIDQNNMKYKMDLGEVTDYLTKSLFEDIDYLLVNKIREIDKMVRPLTDKIKVFQESVDDLQKSVDESMIKLNDVISEANEAYDSHSQELEKYSDELSEKKDFENLVVTNEETLEDLISRLLDEKLYPIIERIG